MINTEMERLQFFRCRNLSLIVPLSGLACYLLTTEIIPGNRALYPRAASNDAYLDGVGNSSGSRGMEVQLPS